MGRTDQGYAASPLADAIASFRTALAGADLTALADDERLSALRELELATRSAAAVSVRLQVDFRDSQVSAQVRDGVARSRAGASVADDLATVRMTSPAMASRERTSARALSTEMPLTFTALQEGRISGFQARVVTEATVCLSTTDRGEVDTRLAPLLTGASTKEVGALTRGLVYEVDPAGFVRRARRAAADRGVSIRPVPDVMALLSARLPAAQAVACHAALHRDAVARRASGDPRTLAQLMADELLARLTGRTVVDGIDVEVGLVMTDTALLAGTSEAAELQGYGPIPAELARGLLRPSATGSVQGSAQGEPCPDGIRCTSAGCTLVHGVPPAPTGPPAAPTTPGVATAARAWVRRLYVDPGTGVLRDRDPRRRLFTGGIRALVIARDRTCRSSWCGAPLRTVDHITRFSEGGLTTADNGRGLCERCNLARERPRALPPPPEHYRPPPPQLPAFATGDPPATRQR
ncbi:HNH endonuclease [Serinicoccus sp. LYQ131]|uniref:HNH endonuclease n=1 Tax=Serinicoccus sp. LYQ131 TaxID=3378797 RepID=UPI003853E569